MNTLLELSRYQRGQSEFLFELVQDIRNKDLLSDETILEFTQNFIETRNMDDDEGASLMDYVEIDIRNKMQDKHKPFLVHPKKEEMEDFGTILEKYIIEEEMQEQAADHAFNDLPPNVINVLEMYETMDDLMTALNKLTIDSLMVEIGQTFGYENNEFIETTKIDIASSDIVPDNIKERVLTLEGNETFQEYIRVIGGENPQVALDGMRMQFARMVNDLTG